MEVILVRHAFNNYHCVVTLPDLSRSLITSVLPAIVFIKICSCQFPKVLSLVNAPLFLVTFPYFLIPAIFSVEQSLLLLAVFDYLRFYIHLTDFPECDVRDHRCSQVHFKSKFRHRPSCGLALPLAVGIVQLLYIDLSLVALMRPIPVKKKIRPNRP
ncbi:MAG: putative tail tube protein [Segetibacter sp.]|jgi:hypothetical protein|nr:putative tail tube protein [Segetibacter sp.]